MAKNKTKKSEVTTSVNKEVTVEHNVESNLDEATVDKSPESNQVEATVEVDKDAKYQTVLVGFAPKLSTKATGKVGYELSLNDDDSKLYLRLTSNDSGGLFSKEWVSIDDTLDLLDKQGTDKPFKSSVFKAVIKGGSANNVSFFSAVMRSEDIALVVKSEKSQFLHVVNPLLTNRRDCLMKLEPLPTTSLKAKE
jgi:hypothetical protein